MVEKTYVKIFDEKTSTFKSCSVIIYIFTRLIVLSYFNSGSFAACKKKLQKSLQ